MYNFINYQNSYAYGTYYFYQFNAYELPKETNYNKCEKCIEGYYLTEYKDSCTKEKNCLNGDKNMGICKQCKTG